MRSARVSASLPVRTCRRSSAAAAWAAGLAAAADVVVAAAGVAGGASPGLLAPPEAAGPAPPQAATTGAAAAPIAAMPKVLRIVRRLNPPTWLTRDIVFSPSRPVRALPCVPSRQKRHFG